MALSFSAVRGEIASKVDALSGFKESRQSPDYFGRTQDTIAHKGFSVQVQSSTAMEERQRRAVGEYVQTSIRLIFAYRLRPLDIYPTDYDNAMDAEETVINAVLQAYAANNRFTIRYLGSLREVTESQEYIIITTEFQALHTI
jgi:hypothetical protein